MVLKRVKKSAASFPKEFFVNKPFVIILITKENSDEDESINLHNVLFYGKITKPSNVQKVQHDEL